MNAAELRETIALRIRENGVAGALAWPMRSVARRCWRTVELRIYRWTPEELPPLRELLPARRDHVEDFDLYERVALEQASPAEMRVAADARRRDGHHCYTLVDDGRLVHYGWLIDRQTIGRDPLLGQAYVPEPGSAALYDFFTHPLARGRGNYRRMLQRILHDAVTEGGAERAYITVYGDNRTSRHVIEQVGFRYVGSLFRTRRFGIDRRRHTLTDPALSVHRL